MPLDRETKSALRNRVSLANRSNVLGAMDEVALVRRTLTPDDPDHQRLGAWLVDLRAVAAGAVIGRS